MLLFSTTHNIGFFFIFSLSLVLVSSIKSGEIKRYGNDTMIESLPDYAERVEAINQYSDREDLSINIAADWKTCVAAGGSIGSFVASPESVKNFVIWVSDWYKRNFAKHYCPNGDEGSYDAYQGGQAVTIYTKMWATGRNCDSTAEKNTIAGSMWNYIEEHHKNSGDNYIWLPEAECMYGDHGGTIKTHLSYGTNKDKVYGQDCSNKKGEDCKSGGKNDLK
uniref:ARAD1A00132p n=1 Tax=Blastobotrys adeninivorans TaxID=409370 RepID=A0A060SWA0_BLAAD